MESSADFMDNPTMPIVPKNPDWPGGVLHVDSCGRIREQPEHHMKRRQSMDHLLMWVLAGKGFSKEGRKSATCVAGDLVVLNADIGHEYGSDADEPWDILFVHFSGSEAEAFSNQLRNHTTTPPVIPLGLHDAIRRRFEDMLFAHQLGPGGALRAHTALYALLGQMIHQLDMSARLALPDSPLDAAAVQRYVESHLHEPLNLDQLAEFAALSPTHFSRLFKSVFQTSPMRYVTEQRIARAGILLRETTMPIQRIGPAIGYDDPFYFSRVFTKETGMSPRQYRQRFR